MVVDKTKAYALFSGLRFEVDYIIFVFTQNYRACFVCNANGSGASRAASANQNQIKPFRVCVVCGFLKWLYKFYDRMDRGFRFQAT